MTQTANNTIDTLLYLRKANGLPIVSLWAVKFAANVSIWTTRRNTRLALSRLSDADLRDVGLTPTQAKREAARMFWQI